MEVTDEDGFKEGFEDDEHVQEDQHVLDEDEYVPDEEREDGGSDGASSEWEEDPTEVQADTDAFILLRRVASLPEVGGSTSQGHQPHQRIRKVLSYTEETRMKVEKIKQNEQRDARRKEEARRRAIVQKRKLDEIRRQQRQAHVLKKTYSYLFLPHRSRQEAAPPKPADPPVDVCHVASRLMCRSPRSLPACVRHT